MGKIFNEAIKSNLFNDFKERACYWIAFTSLSAEEISSEYNLFGENKTIFNENKFQEFINKEFCKLYSYNFSCTLIGNSLQRRSPHGAE